MIEGGTHHSRARLVFAGQSLQGEVPPQIGTVAQTRSGVRVPPRKIPRPKHCSTGGTRHSRTRSICDAGGTAIILENGVGIANFC